MLNNKQDTTIVYNFSKLELTDFRVYVTTLERDSKLYKIDEIELKKKDSIILNQATQIINKDSIIEFKDSVIVEHKLQLSDLNKKYTTVKALEIKYKKQADTIPY